MTIGHDERCGICHTMRCHHTEADGLPDDRPRPCEPPDTRQGEDMGEPVVRREFFGEWWPDPLAGVSALVEAFGGTYTRDSTAGNEALDDLDRVLQKYVDRIAAQCERRGQTHALAVILHEGLGGGVLVNDPHHIAGQVAEAIAAARAEGVAEERAAVVRRIGEEMNAAVESECSGHRENPRRLHRLAVAIERGEHREGE